MSRLGLFLILAVAMVCIGEIDAQPRRCPRNEVWNSCGTACEPSCRNPHPQICTMQCVSRCFCRRGWFRNNDGICVRRCQYT